MSAPREPGFYWVRQPAPARGDLQVVRLDELDVVLVIGWDRKYKTDDFEWLGPADPPPDAVPEAERCKECQGRPCSRCEGTGREPTP